MSFTIYQFFNCLWSGNQLKHGFHSIWLSPNESLHFFFHTQHRSVISAAAEISLNEKEWLSDLSGALTRIHRANCLRCQGNFHHLLQKYTFGRLGQGWASGMREEEGGVEGVWSPLTLRYVCSTLVSRCWKSEVRKFTESLLEKMSCRKIERKAGSSNQVSILVIWPDPSPLSSVPRVRSSGRGSESQSNTSWDLTCNHDPHRWVLSKETESQGL